MHRVFYTDELCDVCCCAEAIDYIANLNVCLSCKKEVTQNANGY